MMEIRQLIIERALTPNTVVGEVHTLFALAGGGYQSAVGIQDGLLEEAVGLMLPDADADVVIDVPLCQ